VLPASLLEDLSPHARVATAVAPFLVALVMRVILGKGRLTWLLITAATVWFAANVLMTPYSARMRQDIQDVEEMFR
jgi:hypothetical protein